MIITKHRGKWKYNWSQVSPQNLKYFRPSLPTSKKIYTPSAKGSGEESVLNDKREKIKQSRRNKKREESFVHIYYQLHVISYGKETSEMWKLSNCSFLFFLFYYFLFCGTIQVWSQLFSNSGMNKQSICHKRLPPTCFVLQFFFNLGEGVQMQPKLDGIQLAALSFFSFIYLFIYFCTPTPMFECFSKK